MNRRSFLAAGLLPALAAGCGTGGAAPTTAATGDAPAPALEQRVGLAGVPRSWDPADVAAFAQRSGVSVASQSLASDAVLLDRLSSSGGAFDVVLPDAEHALIESTLGLLHPLDHAQLPNLGRVDSRWAGLISDSHSRYAVAKDAGVTAIVRRSDRLPGSVPGWPQFFAAIPRHPELSVGFSDDPVLVVGLALVALGHSINSDDQAEVDAAARLLTRVRPYVDRIGASPVEAFSDGRLDLAMADSDEVRQIQQARALSFDTRVQLPRHGRLWVRTCAIAAGAAHPRAAHALINDFLDPRVEAREMAYAGGEPSTPASLKLVQPAALDQDALVVMPDDVLKGSEVLRPTPLGLQQRLAVWNAFTGA